MFWHLNGKLLSAFLMLFMGQTGVGANITESLNPEQKLQYLELSNNLRCPTCTGLSVLQSEAEFSVQIREAVAAKVKEGMKNQAIQDYFVERYGLWILREPPKEGFHLFAWLAPGLSLILGPFFIWLFFWRRSQIEQTHGQRSSREILDEFYDRVQRG